MPALVNDRPCDITHQCLVIINSILLSHNEVFASGRDFFWSRCFVERDSEATLAMVTQGKEQKCLCLHIGTLCLTLFTKGDRNSLQKITDLSVFTAKVEYN